MQEPLRVQPNAHDGSPKGILLDQSTGSDPNRSVLNGLGSANVNSQPGFLNSNSYYLPSIMPTLLQADGKYFAPGGAGNSSTAPYKMLMMPSYPAPNDGSSSQQIGIPMFVAPNQPMPPSVIYSQVTSNSEFRSEGINDLLQASKRSRREGSNFSIDPNTTQPAHPLYLQRFSQQSGIPIKAAEPLMNRSGPLPYPSSLVEAGTQSVIKQEPTSGNSNSHDGNNSAGAGFEYLLEAAALHLNKQ